MPSLNTIAELGRVLRIASNGDIVASSVPMPPPPPPPDPVFKCPHCNEVIEYVHYSVRVYENGSCSIEQGNGVHTNFTNGNTDRVTPPVNIQTVRFDNWECDNSEWDGTPDYECPHCDASLCASEIIIEGNEVKPEEEPKPEPIIPPEPDNAIESETHLILRWNEEIRPRSIDMSTLGICVCEVCNHTFIPEPRKNNEYSESKQDAIVFCPKCMNIIDKKENIQAVLNKTIHDKSYISS